MSGKVSFFVTDLNFIALSHALELRNGVCYHDRLEGGLFHAVQGGPREDSVCGDGVDFLSPRFQKPITQKEEKTNMKQRQSSH